MGRPTKPMRLGHDEYHVGDSDNRSGGIDNHPNNSGHNDSPGCFRCHGSKLRNAAGESISTNCTLCHVILAMRESDPEILVRLGIGQRTPNAVHNTSSNNEDH
jgi:hypothetical protein